MKKIYFLGLLFLCFIGACTKNGADPVTSKVSLIDQAQSWYKENSNLTLAVNWDKAVVARGNKKILIPFNWTAKIDSVTNAKRTLVIYADEKSLPYKAEIVEIIPSTGYGKTYGDKYYKGYFTGTLALYDLEMNFKYGQSYINGRVKYISEVEKFKNQALATTRPQTESINCSWVQSGFVDTDGVFTRVNTYVCAVSGGGNGSDPGVDPAINCKIDPDNPTNCEVQGGFEEPTEYPQDNLNGIEAICDKSFKFKQVIELENGLGGWQIAGVQDIHMHIVDAANAKLVYHITPGATVYFGLPVVGGGQGNISLQYAAKIAGDAVEYAENKTMQAHHDGTLNILNAGSEFRRHMNVYMSFFGGRANLSEPGLSISVTPTQAQYSKFLTGCL